MNNEMHSGKNEMATKQKDFKDGRERIVSTCRMVQLVAMPESWTTIIRIRGEAPVETRIVSKSLAA